MPDGSNYGNNSREWVKEDPAYYRGDNPTYDAIDVIANYRLDFDLGCAVKYILRAGKKPGNDFLTDLRKAHRVLTRRIEREQEKPAVPQVPDDIQALDLPDAYHHLYPIRMDNPMHDAFVHQLYKELNIPDAARRSRPGRRADDIPYDPAYQSCGNIQYATVTPQSGQDRMREQIDKAWQQDDPGDSL